VWKAINNERVLFFGCSFWFIFLENLKKVSFGENFFLFIASRDHEVDDDDVFCVLSLPISFWALCCLLNKN